MPLKGKKALITCGPTWMAVDPVRVLSNVSTGELGQGLAKRLHQERARVTLLEGPVRDPLQIKGVKKLGFRYYDELKALLAAQLRLQPDIVIHAAAVSDYRCRRVKKVKIPSRNNELTLTFVPVKKLINTIKRISPQSFLVGFKLESRLTAKNMLSCCQGLFQQAGCDLVVVNTLAGGGYQGHLIDARAQLLATAESRRAIITRLVSHLRHRL